MDDNVKKINDDMRNKEYNEYVKEVTPTHNTLMNCIHAFIAGGIICVIGQIFTDVYMNFGVDKETAGLYTTLSLIAVSAILTGLNVYPSIVKWAGAGALVPITGFANSVAAPAIEFKKEGWIFGVGCKIFTIAGPVILYGILSSFVLGLIYFVFGLV